MKGGERRGEERRGGEGSGGEWRGVEGSGGEIKERRREKKRRESHTEKSVGVVVIMFYVRSHLEISFPLSWVQNEVDSFSHVRPHINFTLIEQLIFYQIRKMVSLLYVRMRLVY